MIDKPGTLGIPISARPTTGVIVDNAKCDFVGVTGTGLIAMYERSLVFGGVSFLSLCAVPILAKWMLVGRWKSQEIPIWSLTYVRFWIVKSLMRSNPVVYLLVGSPLYGLYLRALGARVGRGVVIFSRNVPICTDLLTIGDGTVIRKDSFFSTYRARLNAAATTVFAHLPTGPSKRVT